MGNCQAKSEAAVVLPKGHEYDTLNADTKSVDSEENKCLIPKASSEEVTCEDKDALVEGKGVLEPLALPELAKTVASKPPENFGFGLISERDTAASIIKASNSLANAESSKEIRLTMVEGQEGIETNQGTPPTSNKSHPDDVESRKGHHGPVSVDLGIDSPSSQSGCTNPSQSDRTNYISPSSTVSSPPAANKGNVAGTGPGNTGDASLAKLPSCASGSEVVALNKEGTNETITKLNEHQILGPEAKAAASEGEEINGTNAPVDDRQITVSAGQEMCSWALEDIEEQAECVGEELNVAPAYPSNTVKDSAPNLVDCPSTAPASSKDKPVDDIATTGGAQQSACLDQKELWSSGKDHRAQKQDDEVPRRFTFHNFKEGDTQDQIRNTGGPNLMSSDALMTPPSNVDKSFGPEMYLSPPTPEYEEEGVEVSLSMTDLNTEKDRKIPFVKDLPENEIKTLEHDNCPLPKTQASRREPQLGETKSVHTPMELVEFSSNSIVRASTATQHKDMDQEEVNNNNKRRDSSPKAQTHTEEQPMEVTLHHTPMEALVEYTSDSIVPTSDVARRQSTKNESDKAQTGILEEQANEKKCTSSELVGYPSNNIVPASGINRCKDTIPEIRDGRLSLARNLRDDREKEKPDEAESIPASMHPGKAIVVAKGAETKDALRDQGKALQQLSIHSGPSDTDENSQSNRKCSYEVDQRYTKKEATAPAAVGSWTKDKDTDASNQNVSKTEEGKEQLQSSSNSVSNPSTTHEAAVHVVSTSSLSRRSKNRRKTRSRHMNFSKVTSPESTKDNDASANAAEKGAPSTKNKSGSPSSQASSEAGTRSVSASTIHTIYSVSSLDESVSSAKNPSDTEKEKESALPPKSTVGKSNPPAISSVHSSSLSRRSRERRRSRSRSVNRNRVGSESDASNAGNEVATTCNSRGKPPSSLPKPEAGAGSVSVSSVHSLNPQGKKMSTTENESESKKEKESVLPPKSSIKSDPPSSHKAAGATATTTNVHSLGRQARRNRSRSRSRNVSTSSKIASENQDTKRLSTSVEIETSETAKGPQKDERLPLSPKAQNNLSSAMPYPKPIKEKKETNNTKSSFGTNEKKETMTPSKKEDIETAPALNRSRTLSERKREKALNAIKSRETVQSQRKETPTAIASKEEHKNHLETKTEAVQSPAAPAAPAQRATHADIRKRRLDRARRLRANQN